LVKKYNERRLIRVFWGGANDLGLKKKGQQILLKIKRKYFRPKVMRRIVSEGNAAPRLKTTLGDRQARPLVYRASSASNMAQTTSALEKLIGSHFTELIVGRRVLLKYNLNTANPYPASVDPQMLRAVVDVLLSLGAAEVSTGDCCTVSLIPTHNQVRKAGLAPALAGRAKLICFDDLPWVTVNVGGEYLKNVTVPRVAMETETVISLANLKTHYHAVMTGAIKLAVGFMHPLERYALHREHLQEKIAEINLAVQSDLYIMDARTVMITGGPDFGRTVDADTILVSSNPLALDLEAYKMLYSLKVENDCLEEFKEDPFSLTQLRHARDIGIGGKPWQGYAVEDILKQ
jgi:uncharacterized protein (DUF362 family)